MDSDEIDLLNLPRELQIMVGILLTVQHCGNRPADLGDLACGLYGEMSDHTPEGQEECVQELAAVLDRLYRMGWISRPLNGHIILTDIGDEKATVLRQYYEAMGVIDFSRI